ncbi:MAG: NHLP bacteriocin system secretion protein [Symploca sp. SIO3E6]|nr:NHLP bacteriocin system secretion protein [Caldora sp. SIO3E6]
MSEEEKPTEKPTRLFRQKLLDRLDEPNDIEQLMQVVNPVGCLLLVAVLGGLGLVGVWSVVGRIPITLKGTGVLMRPQSLVQLQSTTTGQLESTEVEEGQCIKQGDVLATVNPEDLKQQLGHLRTQLVELQAAVKNTSVLTSDRLELERRAIASRRRSLEERRADTRTLISALKANSSKTIAQQRQLIKQQLQGARSLNPTLQDQRQQALARQRQNLEQRLNNARNLLLQLQENLEKTRKLLARGFISENELFQEERQVEEQRQSIAELETQVQDMQVQELELEEQALQSQTRINELELQLRELAARETEAQQQLQEYFANLAQLKTELTELDAQAKQLEEQSVENTLAKKNQIRDLTQEIAQLERQIAENSTIVSPYTGCIQSLTTMRGQLVSAGSALGTIEVQPEGSLLVAVAYFPVKEGKQIQRQMSVQVTPDNVERSRFGGILGTVNTVSAFPVSQEDAIAAVGNPQLVDLMMAGEARLEVTATLALDESTPSGYQWSSSVGPEQGISGGTTCSIWVQLESKPPITFVFPFVSQWVGI